MAESELLKNMFDEEDESVLFTASIGEIVEVDGTFNRMIHENNGFFIGAFTDNFFTDFTALGNVPFELKENRVYRISGTLEERYNKFSKRNERQIKIHGMALLPPKGEIGIIKYLQSLKGLKLRAYSLYETYKDETITIIKKYPERVAREVPGISLKLAESFQSQLLDAEDSSQTITFLLNIGMTLKESNNLFRLFGDKCETDIMENPYILCSRRNGYPGFNFRKADNIAKRLGAKMDSIERIKAGVVFSLENQGMNGHCYADWDVLVSESKRTLALPTLNFTTEEIENAMETMFMEKSLIMDDERIYLAKMYRDECDLGKNIKRLSEKTPWNVKPDIETMLDDYLVRKGLTLEAAQREAVISFVSYKGDICILNGMAGSGKTFTASVILDILSEIYQIQDNQKLFEKLLAPTGKAAKVLKKSVGKETMTIHRALGATEGEFMVNETDPLIENCILIDETSMLDTSIANALMSAIKTGSKVILMGDTNQLPSIGAGNVLLDLIASNVAKVVTLTVSKRQKEGSSIYENSERILAGLPIKPNNSDSYWLETTNTSHTGRMTVKAVSRMVMNKSITFGLNDIQVLSPMKIGPAGTRKLNYDIQQLFNGEDNGLSLLNYTFECNGIKHELRFKKGDKVIQKKNNSELSWYAKVGDDYVELTDGINGIVTNGEQGIIEDIVERHSEDSTGRVHKAITIIVKYEDGYVLYHEREKDNLDHAYAISVHKSQGSQWAVVIQALSVAHSIMLENNLFYTGMTRAGDICVLVGERGAIKTATLTKKSIHRKTNLVNIITGE